MRKLFFEGKDEFVCLESLYSCCCFDSFVFSYWETSLVRWFRRWTTKNARRSAANSTSLFDFSKKKNLPTKWNWIRLGTCLGCVGICPSTLFTTLDNTCSAEEGTRSAIYSSVRARTRSFTWFSLCCTKRCGDISHAYGFK